MFASDQYLLKQFYEEITMKKMNIEDGLPLHFCYMCAALLYKFHKFKLMCHTAENALYQLLEKGPIRSSLITEKYGQYKHLDNPSINVIQPNKNVKTCIIKSKYLEECEQPIIGTIGDHKTMEITANIEKPMILIPDVMKAGGTNLGDNELMIKTEVNDVSDDDQISVKTNLFHNEVMIKTEINDASDDEISLESNLSNNELLVENKAISYSSDDDKIRGKTNLSDDKSFTIHIDMNNVFDSEQSSDDEILSNIKTETDENLSNIEPEGVINNGVKLNNMKAMGRLVCRFCGMRYKQKHLTNREGQHSKKFKCLRCNLVCVSETTNNHTIAVQPDEPIELTDLPVPSRSNVLTKDIAVSTSFPETFSAAARKSRAQKQREYRQRMAASRTPEQLLAARKANAERQRKSRLRKAANSSILSD